MTIDDVIGAMYDSMCFEEGDRPDWKRQSEVFAPGARLVRVNDEGVFEFDPLSFREDLETKISAGVITKFWESEVERDTRIFEDVAHVLSVYETRPGRDDQPDGRAVKSIQLFRRDGRWWISAMLWRRRAAAMPPMNPKK